MLSFLLYNTVAQAVWCPFEPPAIGSIECPDGFICKDFQCQQPALGASTSDRVVCTVAPPNIGAWLCDEGEDCIDHKCVSRLGASGTEKSSVGGKCGSNGVFDAPTYECADGLICNPPMRNGMHIFGAYGTCAEKPLGSWHPARANPVSGLGGKCGWPGYTGGETFDCASGLICNRHGKMGGYGTCEQAPLGASTDGVAQLGEECACADCGPAGITRPCASGLICFNSCSIIPGCEGGMSTCQYPAIGSSNPVSGLGGKCGWPGYPGAETFDCASGLTCNRHGKMGGYGTCEQAPLGASNNRVVCTVSGGGSWLCKEGEECVDCAYDENCERKCAPRLGASANPVSGIGGKCGWPGYLGAETFDCASGLICNRHGRMGGYGTCEQAPLGASANPVSGRGGKCGWPGYPGAETFDCASGLICNRQGKMGGYGTCEQAPLGAGFHYCQTDADCPSTEPICHHPPKDFPELMPTCIADEFGSAPLGSSLASCMTSADCPEGKTCVNPLVMGAPVEGWCA